MTRTPKSTWPIASARNNPVVSSSWWPLFDLTIRTPRLVMRPPRDEDVFAIVELASAGIHDPKEMPFRFPWTDVASPQFERNSLQFHWRVRATWTVEQWQLPFAVWVEGEIVGQQDIMGTDFVHTRTFETGSWLGQRHQGQGIGKEMRTAILHLGFLGLSATRAETGAYEHNMASLGVTRALGYEDNGDAVHAPRGEPQVERKFKMSREQFEAIRRDDITIENLEPCLPMFGLADA
jgi:RimJ/RimL family protein N-acetyltransferase